MSEDARLSGNQGSQGTLERDDDLNEEMLGIIRRICVDAGVDVPFLDGCVQILVNQRDEARRVVAIADSFLQTIRPKNPYGRNRSEVDGLAEAVRRWREHPNGGAS